MIWEYGWVIELSNTDGIAYWDGRGGNSWSIDHMDAVRFSRRQDAEKVNQNLVGFGAVREHAWGVTPKD